MRRLFQKIRRQIAVSSAVTTAEAAMGIVPAASLLAEAANVMPAFGATLPAGGIGGVMSRSARSVPEHPWRLDVFDLLARRHLLAPCPSCSGLAWEDHEWTLRCARCGYAAAARDIVQPCPCADCTFGRLEGSVPRHDTPTPITRAALLEAAPPGLYVLVTDDDPPQEVRLYVRQSFDAGTGAILHDVTCRVLARVTCALSDGPHTNDPGIPRQPESGNYVRFGEEPVDWRERRQARGEAPRPLSRRCAACDHVTTRDLRWSDEGPLPQLACEVCGGA